MASSMQMASNEDGGSLMTTVTGVRTLIMKTGAAKEYWTTPALTMRSQMERRQDRRTALPIHQLPLLSILVT